MTTSVGFLSIPAGAADAGKTGIGGEIAEKPRAPLGPMPRSGVTILGTLSGYNGPWWASRMYFQPGCWFVSGHRREAGLSFVIQVLHE